MLLFSLITKFGILGTTIELALEANTTNRLFDFFIEHNSNDITIVLDILFVQFAIVIETGV